MHEYWSNKKWVHVCIIVFYFGETSMCLCHIVSGNIHYLKNALKITTKLMAKQKRIIRGYII